MARTATKSDAVAQMSTMPERVAVVETKVDAMIVCIDEIKSDVNDLHDCLDQTRDAIVKQLDGMLHVYEVNRDRYYDKAEEVQKHNQTQHAELSAKIGDLEKLKSKYTMWGVGALAFISGTMGTHVNLPTILKFFGL